MGRDRRQPTRVARGRYAPARTLHAGDCGPAWGGWGRGELRAAANGPDPEDGKSPEAMGAIRAAPRNPAGRGSVCAASQGEETDAALLAGAGRLAGEGRSAGGAHQVPAKTSGRRTARPPHSARLWASRVERFSNSAHRGMTARLPLKRSPTDAITNLSCVLWTPVARLPNRKSRQGPVPLPGSGSPPWRTRKACQILGSNTS